MDHIKHMTDGLLGIATLANFFKLIIAGFSILPAVLTVISTLLAIVWYCIRIREYLKNKKVNDERF